VVRSLADNTQVTQVAAFVLGGGKALIDAWALVSQATAKGYGNLTGYIGKPRSGRRMRWGVITLGVEAAASRAEKRSICDAVCEVWRSLEGQCVGLMLPSQQGKVDGWRGEAIQLLGPEVAARSLEREVKVEQPCLQVQFRQLLDPQFAEARRMLLEALKYPLQYEE
jgi:triphosphoribosyl-dephospho-CoA synthetase